MPIFKIILITKGFLVNTGFQNEVFFFILSNSILNNALIHNVKKGANIWRVSIVCQLIFMVNFNYHNNPRLQK